MLAAPVSSLVVGRPALAVSAPQVSSPVISRVSSVNPAFTSDGSTIVVPALRYEKSLA